MLTNRGVEAVLMYWLTSSRCGSCNICKNSWLSMLLLLCRWQLERWRKGGFDASERCADPQERCVLYVGVCGERLVRRRPTVR